MLLLSHHSCDPTLTDYSVDLVVTSLSALRLQFIQSTTLNTLHTQHIAHSMHCTFNALHIQRIAHFFTTENTLRSQHSRCILANIKQSYYIRTRGEGRNINAFEFTTLVGFRCPSGLDC